jgi:hypothetical protein
MNDDQVRELLDSAVADVEPRDGLAVIRSRTAAARRRRGWAWGVGGALAAVAAAAVAVAVLGGASPRDTPVSPAGSTDGDVAHETGRMLPVWFVGDTGVGPRLFEEVHLGTGDTAALRLAVRGSSFDPDYRSPWPAGTSVDSVQAGRDAVTVHLLGDADLTARPASMSAAEARIAVQQLVRTAQAAPGRSGLPVDFEVASRPVKRLLGVDVSRPVAATPGDEVLSPVSISSPAEMKGRSLDPLSSPLTVTGHAAAFEANVQWELMQGDTVVEHGFTTARECCTLAPYSFTLTAPPGSYTLVVHEEDASGGEGTPSTMDTKDITIGS